jgi:hypothetical protein
VRREFRRFCFKPHKSIPSECELAASKTRAFDGIKVILGLDFRWEPANYTSLKFHDFPLFVVFLLSAEDVIRER